MRRVEILLRCGKLSGQGGAAWWGPEQAKTQSPMSRPGGWCLVMVPLDLGLSVVVTRRRDMTSRTRAHEQPLEVLGVAEDADSVVKSLHNGRPLAPESRTNGARAAARFPALVDASAKDVAIVAFAAPARTPLRPRESAPTTSPWMAVTTHVDEYASSVWTRSRV